MNPTNPDRPTRDSSEFIWFALSALVIGAGIFASSALLIDYVRPSPVFCAETGGCHALRQSSYGFMHGVPLPAVGVLGYLSLAIILLVRGHSARLIQLSLAAFGATVATLLIVLQIRLNVFCKYCLVTDIGMLAVLALSFWRMRRAHDRPNGKISLASSTGIWGVALGIPMALGFFTPKPQNFLPPLVQNEMAKTPADQVCVVDFVDYECPYCRQTHSDFSPTLAEHAKELRLVRVNVPLDMHPHAMTAARAACCAETMGKGDAMSDALFTAPVESLTTKGCEDLATQLGLDSAKFHACMDDPTIAKRIDSERASFREQGGHGLPTIWIDRFKVEGAQGPDVLRTTVERALHEKTNRGS